MAYRGEDLDLRIAMQPQELRGEPHGGGRGEPRAGGRDEPRLGARGAPSYPGGYDANAAMDGASGAVTFWVDDVVLAAFNHAYDVAAAHRAPEVRIAHLLHALTRIEETAQALQARGVGVINLMRESASLIARDAPMTRAGQSAHPQTSEEMSDVLRHAARRAYRHNAAIDAADLVDVLFEFKADFAGIELLGPSTEPNHTSPRPEPQGFSTVRNTPRDQFRMPGSAQGGAPEQRYGTQRDMRMDLVGSAADSIQNSRLDALEQMLRALGTDLQNERQTFSEVLEDMQVRMQSPNGGYGNGYAEPQRAAYYEPAPEPFREPAREPMRAPAPEPQPQPQPTIDTGRLDQILRDVAELNRRLSGFERSLSNLSSDGTDLSPVVERLARLETLVTDVQKDRSNDTADVADRLADIETLITDRGPETVDLKPLVDRLETIEDAIQNADRGDDSKLFEEIEQLQRDLAAERASNRDANASISAEIKAIGGAMAAQSAIAERMQTAITDRVERVMASATTGVDPQLMAAINDTRRKLAEEANVREHQRTTFNHDMGEVHEALMKLNANQHTLAKSIDEWREISTSDITLVSSQLDGLRDGGGVDNTELLRTMSANMEGMYRATVERYHRRNRVWYWLFGTDDWIGASWPSQISKIEEDRRNLARAPRPSGVQA